MRLSHGRSGSRPAGSLPARFPVGATYVVEGHIVEGSGGEDGQLRVISRYVVFPGGRRIRLSADFGQFSGTAKPVPRRSRNRNRTASQTKKIIGRTGTTRQQRN
jgi:hypothetical protein